MKAKVANSGPALTKEAIEKIVAEANEKLFGAQLEKELLTGKYDIDVSDEVVTESATVKLLFKSLNDIEGRLATIEKKSAGKGGGIEDGDILKLASIQSLQRSNTALLARLVELEKKVGTETQPKVAKKDA